MTFKLPSGVTGLTKSTSDHRTFTKWVHATARTLDFKPLGVETRDLYCTFDVFELNHDYQPPLWLLHNRFFPLVGASQSLPVIGDALAVEADFIPVPNAEQAVHLGLQPLSDAILNEPLVVEHWASLSAIEVRLAKYFKPHTVGQVIFNYWD